MKIRAALVALASSSILVTGSPAQAFDWGQAIENANSPKGKTVEVVNRMPSNWEVRTAVGFIDKYTTSKVKFVARCSGTAWRCVTIKPGAVKGSATGWWNGKTQTITIDVNEAKRLGYARSAKFRKYLIAHEFGHSRGLPHSHGRNVMYDRAKRQGSYLPLVLNRDQRVTLGKH